MQINQQIRERRLLLGLTDCDVANESNISIAEYNDIEAYPDELYTVVHLQVVKRICDVLSINLMDLLGLGCRFCEDGQPFIEIYLLSRNLLISKQRTKLGLSLDDVGNQIGFESRAIERMENESDFLDKWCLENIDNLSKALCIPLQILLDEHCPKCNK